MPDFDWRAWTPKLAAFYEALLRAQAAGRGSAHLVDLRKAVRYGLTADLASFVDDVDAALSKAELRLELEAEEPTDTDDLELQLSELDEAAAEAENAENDEQEELEPGQARGPDPQDAATLRRIARKQRNDSYNRETLLGYPLIGVRVGNRRYCGPLLVWESTIEYDPRARQIRIRRRGKTPDLNGLLLSRLADDPDDIALVKEAALPILLKEDFGPARIPDLLKALTGIFTPLRRVRDVDPTGNSLKDFLSELGRLRESDGALVSKRLVLVNGPRSNAFLLSDLREIAAQSNPSGDSVLSQIVGDVPSEGAPRVDPINLPFEDTADGGAPLWFPFASNRSQREVAQTATRVKVLTVQGPPGTGKSQTIANLVCHLVTEGHSVLVTSHQRKAMEVLSKMLGEFNGLAMSMLSGDQESLQRLRTQLEGIQDRPPDHLTAESVRRGEEKLLKDDQELRRLQRRFMELKRIEHQEFPGFRRYEDLRALDLLSPLDEPITQDAPQIAGFLNEWAGHFRVLHRSLSSFEAVYRPDGDRTSRVRESQIADTMARLTEAAETLDEPVSENARLIAQRVIEADSSTGTAVVSRISEWVTQRAPELERGLRDLGEDPAQPEVLRGWYAVGGGTRRERIDEWVRAIDRARDFFEGSFLRGREYDWAALERSRVALRRDVSLLREKGGRFFWWYLAPAARRARRALRDRGFELTRSALERSLNDVEEAIRWGEQFDRAEVHLSEMLERIPLSTFGRLRPRTADSVIKALKGARAASEVLRQLDRAPVTDFQAAFGTIEPLFDIGSQRKRTVLLHELNEARRWMAREAFTAELLNQLDLPKPWASRVRAVASGVLEGELDAAATDALSQLKKLEAYYPHFRRLLDLESVELEGLAHTLDGLRGEILQTGEIPEWLSDAEDCIEAHRLSSLLRGSLQVHPDSLDDITEALTLGQDRRRASISEIIRRKRQLATFEAFETPSVRVPLLTLRKLLRRKRMNDSLVALRRSIDYKAVLRVFPCWIATIDDAARLFPPQSGLFDYLVVDEASQCGQATAMPLAFRAKKMIVVGDKKQLQPVTSMFLAQNAVDLLQREHGLHRHPKAHFLDGKDSLLALAEACSNASRFLDEHFRCDPAIIRWSNHRFYDNRLQVLTRRRPDRARIPLEVRELRGPDEDRDDKVNRQEASAVVAEVRRLIQSQEAKGKTIGVISLFRPQAELIQLLLMREFKGDPELLNRHQIVSSTADGFQGDERDIVLYSFRHGPSSHAGSVATIQRSEERLNVAFTRAKERAICFVSMPVHQFPEGAIRDFLEHALTEQGRAADWDEEGDWPDEFESQFEEAVCTRLRDRGLRVTTQVPCGRYRIDLVVEDPDGRQLAVECDGEWKEDALGQLRPEDYQRQDIIERAGWAVHRISGRKWLLNPEREIERTVEALDRQPSRAALEQFTEPTVEIEAFEEDIVDSASAEVVTAEDLVDAPDELAGPSEPFDLLDDDREADEAEADHKDAPVAADPQTLLAHELIHWNILRSPPEWPVIERLQEIHARLEQRKDLSERQDALLAEALRMARNAGFQPSREALGRP